MRAQHLHSEVLFHRPTHSLLELFANVTKVKCSRPTDLTTSTSRFIYVCKTIDIGVKYILQFIMCKILCLVYFTKDREDWFGYGKYMYCHISISQLSSSSWYWQIVAK